MKLLNFVNWSSGKLNKEIQKLMLSKNVNNKICAPKIVRLTYYSSMKKKFRKIRMIFDVENWLWKSIFRTLRQAGKARQSIPGLL